MMSKEKEYDAYRCPYCGETRQTRLVWGEEWFVCPLRCEDADVVERMRQPTSASSGDNERS